MIVRLSKVLIFLVIATSAMAQCDSLRMTCDSLVRAQENEIGNLRRMIERRDDELLLQNRIEMMKDTMHVGFFRDLQFELEEQRRMTKERESYFLLGWAVIAVTAILFGHISFK